MKSEWRVTKNPVMGDTPYGIYRLRDTEAVNHSGNRESRSGWYANRSEAEAVAEGLNEDGGENDDC